MGLRIDLDGLRMRKPGEDAVYLIDQGKKRHIPNPQVYNQLFRTWENIHLDIDIDDIDTGSAIAENALLFKCSDSPKVFLRENLTMRWITSPAVMERFQFSWEKITHWNSPSNSLGYSQGPDISKIGRPD